MRCFKQSLFRYYQKRTCRRLSNLIIVILLSNYPIDCTFHSRLPCQTYTLHIICCDALFHVNLWNCNAPMSVLISKIILQCIIKRITVHTNNNGSSISMGDEISVHCTFFKEIKLILLRLIVVIITAKKEFCGKK